MNSVKAQNKVEGNHQIISLDYIRLKQEHEVTGNDYDNQEPQQTQKSQNSTSSIERIGKAIFG